MIDDDKTTDADLDELDEDARVCEAALRERAPVCCGANCKRVSPAYAALVDRSLRRFRALSFGLRRLREELAERTAARDAARHSLAQEIHEALTSRGHWSPGATPACDLIGAVGLVLDKQDRLHAERDAARADDARSRKMLADQCNLAREAETATATAARECNAARAEVERLREELCGAIPDEECNGYDGDCVRCPAGPVVAGPRALPDHAADATPAPARRVGGRARNDRRMVPRAKTAGPCGDA